MYVENVCNVTKQMPNWLRTFQLLNNQLLKTLNQNCEDSLKVMQCLPTTCYPLENCNTGNKNTDCDIVIIVARLLEFDSVVQETSTVSVEKFSPKISVSYSFGKFYFIPFSNSFKSYFF